ncbi:Retrotransposon gag protein [Ceratobasidium sp. AG-Ba]|nr:Retrotransposon gag protein [Ceratobasidium sp. AG-Ba]
MFQHNLEACLNNLEQNIQGSLFTNDHFNQLRTDLQTILTQTHVARQQTGTNRQPPAPPAPQPPAPPAPQPSAPPLPQPSAPSARIKLAKPEKFDGKKDKSTAFKVSLMQYLRTTYPGSSDEDKIAFILSYLDGKAAEWIEPHALKKLKNLRQKRSVQDYVTEFQTLATHVNYDDLALRDMFYEGLKDEIKMAMLSQMFNVKDDNTSGQMVVDRALLIDQHLEQFAGRTVFDNKNTSSNNKPSALLNNPTHEKLATGDSVYMIGTDGRAVKGKIESIGRNVRGQVVPNVKWVGQSSTVQVPFPALKKDDRPSQGTSRPPPAPPALARARGLGPMDLDGEKRAGGIVCLRCQGKGHMARDCPSKPISGYKAKIEEVKEPDSEEESVKDNA